MPSILPPSRIRVRAVRVLIVEDDFDSAESLAAILGHEGHEGHEIVVALSAAEALAEVEDFTPDVALIDIGLPVITGIDVAEKLRALPRLADCKYVALTGYRGGDVTREIESAGFHALITKPMNIEQLLKIVADTGRECSAC
jgi:CheY-like chemotaxis protein